MGAEQARPPQVTEQARPLQVKRGGFMSVTIAPLSSDEIAAIESVQERFVAAVRGRAAIKTWMAAFPPVTEFAITSERIEGRADLAYVRGAYAMTLQPEG